MSNETQQEKVEVNPEAIRFLKQGILNLFIKHNVNEIIAFTTLQSMANETKEIIHEMYPGIKINGIEEEIMRDS